ncbi:hypothetical protein ACTFIW_007676 [Dictyostelium discoideum]
MSSNRREMIALLMAYQALWWSDTGPISSVRTTLETMPQEESKLDWRAYSRILQFKSRPPQPSFRDELQIIVHSNQELQLATEEMKFSNRIQLQFISSFLTLTIKRTITQRSE